MQELQTYLTTYNGDEARAVLAFMAAHPCVRPNLIVWWLEALSCRS